MPSSERWASSICRPISELEGFVESLLCGPESVRGTFVVCKSFGPVSTLIAITLTWVYKEASLTIRLERKALLLIDPTSPSDLSL